MKATEIALLLSIGVNFFSILVPIFSRMMERKYINEDRKRKFMFEDRVEKYEKCLYELESKFSELGDFGNPKAFNSATSTLYLISSNEAKLILDDIVCYAQQKSILSDKSEFTSMDRELALDSIKSLRELYRKEIQDYLIRN